MVARPISITVSGRILIVFGVFGVLGILLMALMWHTPLMQQILARTQAPIPMQITVGVAGVVIRPACGIALLLRQNWARFHYVGWSLVIIYFLFTPAARQYFTAAAATDAP